jgi:hypothetical protein
MPNDLKVYLPHHRDSRLDDLDLEGRDCNPWALMVMIILIGAMGLAFVHGIVRHEEIEEAKAKAALAERQRIVEAVARDIEDQRRYAAYPDSVVAKEYRSVRGEAQ